MVSRGLVLSLGLLFCMMERLVHVPPACPACGAWRRSRAFIRSLVVTAGLACRHSSAVPLDSRGRSDGQQKRDMLLTSCFKVGPFAPIKHPQDILSVSDDQADLSHVQLGEVHEAHQRVLRLARSPDAGLRRWADGMELTASASNGSRVLEGSGSFATVWWKGVPWLARPLEYWVGMWLQVLAPIPSTTTPSRRQQFGLAQTLFQSPSAPHQTCAERESV